MFALIEVTKQQSMFYVYLYVVDHIIITILRAAYRVMKFKHLYKSTNRLKGAFKRGLKRRIFAPLTFALAILCTIFTVYAWLFLTNRGL